MAIATPILLLLSTVCIQHSMGAFHKLLTGVEDNFYFATSKLGGMIAGKYMPHLRCVVIVTSDRVPHGHVVPITSLPAVRMSADFGGPQCGLDDCNYTNNSNSYDSRIYHKLSSVFVQKCEGYVIQVDYPECFLKMWSKVAIASPYRHTPRLFVLPLTPNSTTRDTFSVREAEYSSDILVAEPANAVTEDIVFNLYTNDFHKQVREGVKNSGLWLDAWALSDGFMSQPSVNHYPEKLKNLQGKEFRISTWTYLPYALTDPLDGTEVRILLEYCRIHNCTCSLVTDQHMWGGIFENGTSNGPVGAVYTDHAEVGIGGYYLWERQHRYVDYSSTYLYSSVTCLVPKPHLIPEWWIPILPFTGFLWATVLLSMAFAVIVLHLISTATLYYTRYAAELCRRKQFTTWTDSVVRVIGLLVLQTPSTRLVGNSPLRYIFTSFEIIYLLLAGSYGGGLSSILTVPMSYPPVDTIEELVDSGMKWAADHSAWVFSLQNSSDRNIEILEKRFEVHTVAELKRLAQADEYAISIERLPGGHICEEKHLSEEAISKRHMMKEALYGSPIVTVLRKGSPYKPGLDAVINRFLDSGLLLHWETDVVRRFLSAPIQLAVEKSMEKFHDNYPLTRLRVSHVTGAFILLGLGLTGSTVCFAIELYLSKRNGTSGKCNGADNINAIAPNGVVFLH